MADIRPPAAGLPSVVHAPARPPNPARTAAQRAFFEAALGRAEAQAAVRRAEIPTAGPAAATATQSHRPADAPEPARYLRPGSIIDIKV